MIEFNLKRVATIGYEGEGLSLNSFYAGGHFSNRVKIKNKFKERFEKLFKENKELRFIHKFYVKMRFNGRIDTDNNAGLIKVFVDTLRGSGYVKDDNKLYFKGMDIQYDEDLNKNKYIIDLYEVINGDIYDRFNDKKFSDTGVYKIYWEDSPNKIYIGSASRNFKSRFKRHIDSLKNGTHHNIIMQRTYNKHGDPVFKILKKTNPEDCIKVEQEYLDSLNPFYNICKVAGSSLGRKASEEEKKNRSKRMIGNTCSKGQVVSKERRAELSKEMKGNSYSKGLKHSPEHINKRVSKRNGKYDAKKIEVIKLLSKGNSGAHISRLIGVSERFVTEVKHGRR